MSGRRRLRDSMTISLPAQARGLHPLHMLLFGAASCYLVTALLCDWAYHSTFEIQWKNFASWLIVGGLVFAGFAIVSDAARLLRHSAERGATALRLAVLLRPGSQASSMNSCTPRTLGQACPTASFFQALPLFSSSRPPRSRHHGERCCHDTMVKSVTRWYLLWRSQSPLAHADAKPKRQPNTAPIPSCLNLSAACCRR